MGLVPGQVLDGTPSSGQIGAELHIYTTVLLAMGSATPSSRATGAENFSSNSVFALAEENDGILFLHPLNLSQDGYGKRNLQMDFLRRAALVSVV